MSDGLISKRTGAITDAEISEWQEHYRRRPWMSQLIAEPDLRCLPEDKLERIWRVRVQLRELIKLASTQDQRDAVQCELAQAVHDGVISERKAREAIARMETRK